ncbi:MAG: potassium channel protein [Deltaproteobacteria bacterium]|nr:potassium channel protein [Deltaproteobacteria bacterium]
MEQRLGHRVWKATGAVLVAVTIGTIGFWLVSGGDVSLGDCLYMTVITLSTVGYGEVIPMTAAARVFASFLIIFGMGSLIYFGSTVVAFWIELDVQKARRRKRMQKTINQLGHHVIVCGGGTTGSHVVRELIAARTPFVIIENQEERIQDLKKNARSEGQELVYIYGDATADETLEEAGLARARGLVAALPSDKDNLYIILSARQANPNLRIVARATEKDAPSKMLHAGADRVVSPNYIGGLRIASEMLRPQVVEFLDMMLRDQEQATRIEQVALPEDSPLVGKCLMETNIRKATDVLVIALREKNGNYTYNPGPEAVLTERCTLIVLGTMKSIIRLRDSIGGVKNSLVLIHPPTGEIDLDE